MNRNMKTKITISLLAIGGSLLLAAGCGKTEKSAPPTTSNAPAQTRDAAAEAQAAAVRSAELDKAAEMAKASEAKLKAEAEQAAAKLAEAEKAASQVADDTKAATQKLQADAEQAVAAKTSQTSAATASLAQQALSAIQQPGQVEQLIVSAKNLTGQNKYAEALKIVAELAKLKLTPEQQAMVDQLKQVAEQQMTKALAAKATDAATQALDDAMQEKK